MIPPRIIRYLKDHNVYFERQWHPYAVRAQELAQTLHVTGYRLAKSVLVEADGQPWVAVLPACDIVDVDRLAAALGAVSVRFLSEDDFAPFFPDCETGAEPPFGGLYGLPVIVDASLEQCLHLVVRAGSHEEVIQLPYAEFDALEEPQMASFAVPQKGRAPETNVDLGEPAAAQPTW